MRSCHLKVELKCLEAVVYFTFLTLYSAVSFELGIVFDLFFSERAQNCLENGGCHFPIIGPFELSNHVGSHVLIFKNLFMRKNGTAIIPFTGPRLIGIRL